MAPNVKSSQGKEINKTLWNTEESEEEITNTFSQKLDEYINTFEHGNCVMGEKQIHPNSKHGIKT